MPQEIDFYFDFVSPYSYLASTALPRLAAEHGAAIRYHPFTLLALMQRVGNRPTSVECANKRAYALVDLRRWAERQQVAFAPNPSWRSIDFAALGRGAWAAIDEGRGADYVAAVYAALWGEARNLGERAELLGVLARAGLDGARLVERAAAAEYTARLEQMTEAAAERGVFGSPTMFVGSEMFFGNDRLDFLAATLRAPA
jgi:2-hydroxychromene-2-carboxylate isomerase